MYTVYVLRFLEDGKRYVGFTSKPLSERVKEHRNGSNRSTKFKSEFKVLYFEEFADESIALARERFFKTGDGRKVLQSKLTGKS